MDSITVISNLFIRLLLIWTLCTVFMTQVINSQNPNIVLFLTDDQDSALGGMEPLTKARSWIADQGVTFQNSFVSTPICCPSRSSILTGLYQHHTNVVNNTADGNCWGREWREISEKQTFATVLKATANYTTFYAGKYLNRYGSGGDLSVPSGWDKWVGLVGNSKYYNYKLSIDGKEESHGNDYEADYLTDLIGRKAIDFLNSYEDMDEKQPKEMEPFLMVLSTPAPHAPFTPAPQYENAFPDKMAPRTPAFNYVDNIMEMKHWFLRTSPAPLSDELVDKVDGAFRDRWRTLLSVDDTIDKVMRKLDALDMLDNTFVILTSDHGYHLGTFALTIDKRMPYETDIRVPLLVRGPGVQGNRIVNDVIVNIDLAPTIVEMGGGQFEGTDGVSFLPSLLGRKKVSKFVESNDIYAQPKAEEERESFLISYHGEYSTNGVPEECEGIVDDQMSQCLGEWDCKCQDVVNNTYFCIRKVTQSENSIYCKFEDNEDFIEVYDLNEDPYQLNNLMINDLDKPKISPSQVVKELNDAKQLISNFQFYPEQKYFTWMYEMMEEALKRLQAYF